MHCRTFTTPPLIVSKGLPRLPRPSLAADGLLDDIARRAGKGSLSPAEADAWNNNTRERVVARGHQVDSRPLWRPFQKTSGVRLVRTREIGGYSVGEGDLALYVRGDHLGTLHYVLDGIVEGGAATVSKIPDSILARLAQVDGSALLAALVSFFKFVTGRLHVMDDTYLAGYNL